MSQVLMANALGKVKSMRLMIAALLATASFLSPINGFAQSADVESTISKVDENGLTITLSDGKNYKVPEEFNFEGLKAGVKVVVFYTEVDGKRVVDDLEVVQ
ncbi:5-enolpyruvylshikimate-3-phosphate synthase [Rhizobium sp. BIGb0125]|nr:5-enolpyruvylshikimate-3-phosphate synthase [Rhizobium sp. BIGb0125]